MTFKNLHRRSFIRHSEIAILIFNDADYALSGNDIDQIKHILGNCKAAYYWGKNESRNPVENAKIKLAKKIKNALNNRDCETLNTLFRNFYNIYSDAIDTKKLFVDICVALNSNYDPREKGATCSDLLECSNYNTIFSNNIPQETIDLTDALKKLISQPFSPKHQSEFLEAYSKCGKILFNYLNEQIDLALLCFTPIEQTNDKFLSVLIQAIKIKCAENLSCNDGSLKKAAEDLTKAHKQHIYKCFNIAENEYKKIRSSVLGYTPHEGKEARDADEKLLISLYKNNHMLSQTVRELIDEELGKTEYENIRDEALKNAGILKNDGNNVGRKINRDDSYITLLTQEFLGDKTASTEKKIKTQLKNIDLTQDKNGIMTVNGDKIEFSKKVSSDFINILSAVNIKFKLWSAEDSCSISKLSKFFLKTGVSQTLAFYSRSVLDIAAYASIIYCKKSSDFKDLLSKLRESISKTDKSTENNFQSSQSTTTALNGELYTYFDEKTEWEKLTETLEKFCRNHSADMLTFKYTHILNNIEARYGTSELLRCLKTNDLKKINACLQKNNLATVKQGEIITVIRNLILASKLNNRSDTNHDIFIHLVNAELEDLGLRPIAIIPSTVKKAWQLSKELWSDFAFLEEAADTDAKQQEY